MTESGVMFDRATAAILIEMARAFVQAGRKLPAPRPFPGGQPPRQSTAMLEIGEVIDEPVRSGLTYGQLKVKLLRGAPPGSGTIGATYADLSDGPEVEAFNWLAPGAFDADSTVDGTEFLKIGQKVLLADLLGTWAVVGLLSGQYVDLLKPDDVSEGWGGDFPGIVTTAGQIGPGPPYKYVVDSLFGLLEKSIGGGSEGDPETELFVLCVKRASVVESLFLRPLADVLNET